MGAPGLRMEGEGGPLAGPPVSAGAVEAAGSLTPARSFPGAEHAFSDFAKAAMAAHGDKA